MQRVVAGSARRLQQSTAARRRSASLVTPVTFPSFPGRRSRPDPDAPRADTLRATTIPLPDENSNRRETTVSLLPDEPFNLPPNVESHRGQYEGSYSIIPSVSLSIQQQVRDLERGLSAAFQDDVDYVTDDVDRVTPPRHITVESTKSTPRSNHSGFRDASPNAVPWSTHSTYHDASPDAIIGAVGSDNDDDTFFDTDPPPDFDDESGSMVSQVTSAFGRIFQQTPVHPVTSSIPDDDAPYPQPTFSLDPEAGPYPGTLSSSSDLSNTTKSCRSTRPGAPVFLSPPVQPGIWYNTGPSISQSRISQVTFSGTDVTPLESRLNGTTGSFTFKISSSPDNFEWGLQVETLYDIIHNYKGDSRSNNSHLPPRLILIGRCKHSHLVFGLRINLINSVCQAFPLLIRGTNTTPLVIVHPYLHGYHGHEPDPSLSPRQGLYAVPVSWGGQHLCTSYPLAWGLWADFKYRAQWTPHVHSACGANTRPSPHRTLAAAQRFNTECLRGHPMYGSFWPEIPRYILTQLAHFGVPDLASLTSFRELPKPPRPCGVTLAGAFALRETPETDTP
jgi:hypothetical protein